MNPTRVDIRNGNNWPSLKISYKEWTCENVNKEWIILHLVEHNRIGESTGIDPWRTTHQAKFLTELRTAG